MNQTFYLKPKFGVVWLLLFFLGAVSLTAQERRAVELHALRTQQILVRVPVLERLAIAAAAHHERLDGAGYHSGLVGLEIPLIARILTVADVFDALTSDRPYRKGMAVDEAIDIMGKDIDGAFERPLLEALVSSVR